MQWIALLQATGTVPGDRSRYVTNREEDQAIDDARTPAAPERDNDDKNDDGDLSDMLGELRVLLLSAQLLSAFLITVPFNTGFANIVMSEKRLFLATFILAISSLILLSGPAVQHRLVRPLSNRVRFKKLATRQIVAGCVTLSLALVFATQLVLSEVFGDTIGMVAAGFVATLITLLWWLFPTLLKRSGRL